MIPQPFKSASLDAQRNRMGIYHESRCNGGGVAKREGGEESIGGSDDAVWRKRLGRELTAVLKDDLRLLWDQFEHNMSAIDERPPDDPVESKGDRLALQPTGIRTVRLSQ